MPTYCYECEVCGGFEVDQRMTDSPLTKCPKGHPAKRVLAPVSFHVPAWMSATRSNASERQAVYLKSDEHRKVRQQDERINERSYQAQEKLKSFKRKLADAPPPPPSP